MNKQSAVIGGLLLLAGIGLSFTPLGWMAIAAGAAGGLAAFAGMRAAGGKPAATSPSQTESEREVREEYVPSVLDQVRQLRGRASNIPKDKSSFRTDVEETLKHVEQILIEVQQNPEIVRGLGRIRPALDSSLGHLIKWFKFASDQSPGPEVRSAMNEIENGFASLRLRYAELAGALKGGDATKTKHSVQALDEVLSSYQGLGGTPTTNAGTA